MSYPGYPSYGGAGPSYPPYPNSQPKPEHATSSLSYGGFLPPPHPSPYPSHTPMPQPGGHPSQTPYPLTSAPASFPPYHSHPTPNNPYPPTSNPYPPASNPYPPTSNPYHPASNPYPPASNPYPPASNPYPPASNPYPPASNPYPPAPNPYPPASNPYPPASNPYTPAISPYPTAAAPHSLSAGAPYQPHPHSFSTSHHDNQFPSNLYTSPSVPKATQIPGGLNIGPIRTGNPTVRPVQPFDPRADAEILRKAMKGFGTDEKAIISVLAHRSNMQRQEIALQFKTLYGKDLVSDLKSELTGKFEDVAVALMKPYFEFMAKEVHDAIAGIGTDDETVVEVICSATNQDIHAIKAAYHHMYHRSLEEDLRGDTSGNFKRLLVSLCMGNRSEDYNVNPASVQADAQALLRAGELQVGTDESTFNAVLCQRSYAHLQAVMIEYQRITGHSLEKAIKKEFSGDIEDGLCTILKCVENRPSYFAERLHKSMKGLGTDDRALIRLIVSRCEVDMGEIKQAFETKFGKSLGSFISGDCSGHYKKCLLALIGE